MKKLQSKVYDVSRQLASLLLTIHIGEQIPTTPELADRLGVGFGTVDKALKALKADETIRLRPRGQMGTYLLYKNMAALWSASGCGPVRGMLPLPNTPEFQGLAAGLTETLGGHGIACALSFRNGAASRVDELLNAQCDFVVLSHRASDHCCRTNARLRTIAVLEERSYYSDLIVLRRKDAAPPADEWRIGVDGSSYDHIAFTNDLFPRHHKVPVAYAHVPYLLVDRVIDAAVWHSAQLVPLSLIDALTAEQVGGKTAQTKVENMDGEAARTQAGSMNAAIVADKERSDIATLLAELCDLANVAAIQREVIARKRVPYY